MKDNRKPYLLYVILALAALFAVRAFVTAPSGEDAAPEPRAEAPTAPPLTAPPGAEVIYENLDAPRTAAPAAEAPAETAPAPTDAPADDDATPAPAPSTPRAPDPGAEVIFENLDTPRPTPPTSSDTPDAAARAADDTAAPTEARPQPDATEPPAPNPGAEIIYENLGAQRSAAPAAEVTPEPAPPASPDTTIPAGAQPLPDASTPQSPHPGAEALPENRDAQQPAATEAETERSHGGGREASTDVRTANRTFAPFEGKALNDTLLGVEMFPDLPGSLRAAQIETYEDAPEGLYLCLVPRYAGSAVKIERMELDAVNGVFAPAATLWEGTCTDSYALLIRTTLPEGGPLLRITVAYGDRSAVYEPTYDGSDDTVYPRIRGGYVLNNTIR